MDRRTVLLTGGAGALVVACGPAPPPGAPVVTVNATGQAGMNPGSDGQDRPVTVTLLQLRSLDAFNNADPLSLQTPATALAADLVAAQTLVVQPGATASAAVTGQPGAAFLAVVAGFINPSGKNAKASTPIAAGDNLTATVTLNASGLAVAFA